MKKILLALLLFSSFLLSDITKSFPSLDGRVVDTYKLLNNEAINRINTILENHEKETSNQIVVVILKSLEGYEIADYSYQLGRHWGIGQKDKNNGVLLVISMNDRKLRIEVGYGLEGALTDKISHEIIEYTLKPNFRAQNYEAGITQAVNQIIQAIKGEYTNTKENTSHTDESFFPILFFIVIFLSILLSNISTKSKNLFLYKVSKSSTISSFFGFFTYVISQGFTQYNILLSLFIFIVVFIFNFLTTKKISKPSRSSSYNSYGSSGGFGSSSGGFSSGGFSGGGGSFGGGGASGGW